MVNYGIKVKEKKEQKKDFNPNYRKENSFWKGFKVLDKDFNELVDCRFYGTESGTVYCCIWAYGKDHFSASGRATGWGYEKASASLQEALTNAGVVLNKSIWGTGIISETLEAIAKHNNSVRKVHTVEIYG